MKKEMKKETTYEEFYSELTGIIRELEDETISVDLLTQRVKRAMELIKLCRERLLLTEKEINELIME
jgi:exodeoxyribonuclease VII small subunit